MGDYETKGSGLSKKIAKTMAAANMFETIPEEWKDLKPAATISKSKKNKKKRKATNGSTSEPPVKQQVRPFNRSCQFK